MNSSRVALVAPTFWPVGSQLQESLKEFAEVLQQLGAGVTVFAERIEPGWPARIEFREYEVVRVDRPTVRPWSRGRYGRQIVQALRRTSTHWDVIVVFGAGEELLGLVEAPDLARHLVVRLERKLLVRHGQKAVPRSLVAAIEACAGVMGTAEQVEAWLQDAHVHANQFWCVPESAEVFSDMGPPGSRKEQARSVLGSLHPLLNFEKQQPVVVTAASLHDDVGVLDLVEAWRVVRRRTPRAQLVVAGDGPLARSVWGRVQELNLTGGVHLPGWFDDWSDLFAAADAYVHPLRSELACPVLTKALALGIPTVISRAEPIARVIEHRGDAWLCTPGSPGEIAEGICELLNDSEFRRRIGAGGAQIARRWRSRQPLLQCFAELLSIQPQEVCAVGP